jgi:hypothetical protein
MVACGVGFVVYWHKSVIREENMTIPFNTRTFIPKLVRMLLVLCTYLGRYRITILTYLPEGSDVLVDDVIVACRALEAVAAAVLPSDS